MFIQIKDSFNMILRFLKLDLPNYKQKVNQSSCSDFFHVNLINHSSLYFLKHGTINATTPLSGISTQLRLEAKRHSPQDLILNQTMTFTSQFFVWVKSNVLELNSELSSIGNYVIGTYNNDDNWRSPNLTELTLILFNTELTHLGFEASNLT